jgi:hypothetical protein
MVCASSAHGNDLLGERSAGTRRAVARTAPVRIPGDISGRVPAGYRRAVAVRQHHGSLAVVEASRCDHRAGGGGAARREVGRQEFADRNDLEQQPTTTRHHHAQRSIHLRRSRRDQRYTGRVDPTNGDGSRPVSSPRRSCRTPRLRRRPDSPPSTYCRSPITTRGRAGYAVAATRST